MISFSDSACPRPVHPRRPAATAVIIALVSVITLGVGGGLTAVPAWAHGDESSEEHARQDLAGESMDSIERDTAANAQRLGTSKRVARTAASVGADVAADPGQSGQWTTPVNAPVVPIFQAMLPNGTILMWDSVGDNAAESYPDHTFTRAAVWNPADNSSHRVDVQGYNIFCAGFVQLPDGNVLVVGGNKNSALDGIRQTHLFNWRTETWSRGPDMASERWYPSVTALANGEALVVAGGSGQAEVYQADGTFRPLTGFASFSARTYPFLVPRPDGRVQLVGPVSQMTIMDTAGAGALVQSQNRDGIDRQYGSFATYLPGRTLVSGGGSVTENGQTQVPTRTAVVVDTSGTGASVTPTGAMAFPRRQHNLTVLADGSVLATGGESKSVDGLVDLDNAVLAAERWDPATGGWTTLASASRIRQYHSSAVLLPDGRVQTGGGGICGVCVTKGYLEKNIEYFSPPYLFRKDGSGQLAPRPTISGVPSAAKVGTGFTVTSPQAAVIRKIGLVRLGAPTHSVDQGQRYVPLTFTVGAGNELGVRAPENANVAPPGYYMLFGTDDQGVPSIASTIQILPADQGPARTNLALNQPASASSLETASYGANLANDGNATSRWSSARTDDQWWQVDLRTPTAVDTVSVSWEAAYAKRYEVQTSLDGITFTTAATVDLTAAGTQETTFASRSARYVRIRGITRGTVWGYSIFEARVFGGGRPTNSAPTAAAGPDQAVAAGATVTLDGTASTDPDGSALTYRWTQTGGPAVTLAGATTARPSFTAPAAGGTLGFSLVVNDGTVDSAADAVVVTVAAGPRNVAQGQMATQSSQYENNAADRAVDGRTDGNLGNGSVTHTGFDRYPWWSVDLGGSYAPEQIVVWNRTDCCSTRLRDYWVFVSATPFDTSLSPTRQARRSGVWSAHLTSTPSPSTTITVPGGTRGRYVLVQSSVRTYLSLAEVQVLART